MSGFQAGTPREASHVTTPRGLSHERSRVGTPRKASHVSGLEAGPPCQASHTSSSRNIHHCDWASRPLLRPKTARYDAKMALTKVLPLCFGSMQLCRVPLAYRAWNARVHSSTYIYLSICGKLGPGTWDWDFWSCPLQFRGSEAPDRRKFTGIEVPGSSTGSRRSKCIILSHFQPRTPDPDPV